MPAATIVWGVWGVLTVAGVVLVGAFGRDCPYLDDWGMLAALAGDMNLLQWAWEPQVEHRWLPSRLAFVGVYRLTGDLRGCMVLNVLGSAAVAALFIRTAHRVRGRTSLSDLFFPLAFLHLGHWENWLWSSQICMVSAVVLAAVIVSLAATGIADRRSAVAAAVTIAILPLCGAPGLAFGGPGAVWLGGVALGLWRTAPGRAAVLASGVGVAGVVIAVTALNHPGSPFAGLPRTYLALAGFFGRLVGMVFGPAAEWLWPVFAVVLVGLAAWCVGRIVRLWRDGDRVTAGGFAAMFFAGAGIVAGLTWGRAWAGSTVALSSRYAILMALVASTAFLVCARPGGGCLSTLGPAMLAVLAAIAWPFNLAVGLENGSRLGRQVDALGRDVRDGLPPDLIGERYAWQLFLNHPGIGKDFDAATRLGFAPFRNRGPVLNTQVVAAPVASVHDGGLRLELAAGPRGTIAVRIHGEFVPPGERMADYRVRWQEAGTTDWHEEEFQVITQYPAAVIVRVDGPPAVIEIIPDRHPVGYRVNRVELVVAKPAASHPAQSSGSP